MTNEQIIKKALDKAYANGFEPREVLDSDEIAMTTIIFSHEFAKAFWGDEIGCPICGAPSEEKESRCYSCEIEGLCPDYELLWGYHLQQMVLEEDPIKYLEQFLTN